MSRKSCKAWPRFWKSCFDQLMREPTRSKLCFSQLRSVSNEHSVGFSSGIGAVASAATAVFGGFAEGAVESAPAHVRHAGRGGSGLAELGRLGPGDGGGLPVDRGGHRRSQRSAPINELSLKGCLGRGARAKTVVMRTVKSGLDFFVRPDVVLGNWRKAPSRSGELVVAVAGKNMPINCRDGRGIAGRWLGPGINPALI